MMSDPALLSLWHRPAATALIQSLAWEPPYATGAALKRQKKKKIFPNKLFPNKIVFSRYFTQDRNAMKENNFKKVNSGDICSDLLVLCF